MTTGRGNELRLTAASVKTLQFARSQWGRRGYDEAEVDEFLNRVERELIACANDAAGLRAECERLRRRFIQSQRGGEWMSEPEEAHAMAVARYAEGQAAVERMVSDARVYCGRLTGDAQARYEAMLDEAERVLADARAQASAAADAALDEPVPDPAAGPLRASRASDAYGRTFSRVYLTAALPLAEALVKVLGDWSEQEDRGDAARPAAAASGAMQQDS